MLNNALVQDIQFKKKIIQKELVTWCKEYYRYFPWRENRTPYTILIAEVLLKRTTASAVKGMYENFLKLYPDVRVLAKADLKDLENTLSKIGYHKVRTKILIEMANYILENYNGKIPRTKDKLLKIPHVGNYTANSILSFAYNVPAAILDTNVERIFKRVFLKNAPTVASLKPFQEIADSIMPNLNNQIYNYALLDLGGTVCISGLPRCYLCPIKSVCDYYLLGKPQSLQSIHKS